MIGAYGEKIQKRNSRRLELIEALHASQGLGQKDIHACLDDLFAELKRAIMAGKAVELRGFGTFEVRLRKGRSRAVSEDGGDR